MTDKKYREIKAEQKRLHETGAATIKESAMIKLIENQIRPVPEMAYWPDGVSYSHPQMLGVGTYSQYVPYDLGRLMEAANAIGKVLVTD